MLTARSRNNSVTVQRMNMQLGHSVEVCVPKIFAIRMLLALSQIVNCISCPIKMLYWLFAASKLYKYRTTFCTGEWPCCPFAILW